MVLQQYLQAYIKCRGMLEQCLRCYQVIHHSGIGYYHYIYRPVSGYRHKYLTSFTCACAKHCLVSNAIQHLVLAVLPHVCRQSLRVKQNFYTCETLLCLLARWSTAMWAVLKPLCFGGSSCFRLGTQVSECLMEKLACLQLPILHRSTAPVYAICRSGT